MPLQAKWLQLIYYLVEFKWSIVILQDSSICKVQIDKLNGDMVGSTQINSSGL